MILADHLTANESWPSGETCWLGLESIPLIYCRHVCASRNTRAKHTLSLYCPREQNIDIGSKWRRVECSITGLPIRVRFRPKEMSKFGFNIRVCLIRAAKSTKKIFTLYTYSMRAAVNKKLFLNKYSLHFLLFISLLL